MDSVPIAHRLDYLLCARRWESHDNSFSVAELEKIYAAFLALLPNKKRGVLPISTLTQIIRETGVEDEKVALACAQFFDLNQDCQVNFLEVRSALRLRG